jgi:hypothetical protein
MDLTGSWPCFQCLCFTHKSSRKACSCPHIETHCPPVSPSSTVRSPEQLSCDTQSSWAAKRQQKCPNRGSWWLRFSEIIFTRQTNYSSSRSQVLVRIFTIFIVNFPVISHWQKLMSSVYIVVVTPTQASLWFEVICFQQTQVSKWLQTFHLQTDMSSFQNVDLFGITADGQSLKNLVILTTNYAWQKTCSLCHQLLPDTEQCGRLRVTVGLCTLADGRRMIMWLKCLFLKQTASCSHKK